MAVTAPAGTAEGGRGARARRGVTACVVAVCCYWFSLYLYVPVLSPDAHRLHAGVGAVGLILAAYGFVQFLVRIPTGVWSDRLGRRKPFLTAAIAVCGLAAVGMGLSGSPLELGAFRGLSGLGACGWVAITLLFAEFFPEDRTAWALGVINFMATGSQLLAQFAGGLLAQATGGYAWSFLAGGAASVAGVGASLGFREAHSSPPRNGVPLAERLRVGGQRSVLLPSCLCIGMQYVQFATIYGFNPLLATTRFAAGGTALGLLSLSAGIPSALASLASSRLGARWGARAVGVTGFVLAAAGTALLPLAPSLSLLDGASALVGLGIGVNAPTLMSAAIRGMDPQRRGTAMGFFQSIYAIGMFGGPALAGAIGHAAGMLGLFETTALVGVAGAVVAAAML